MDSFEVRRILDDISSGKASVEALDEVASGLGVAGIEGALDYIREKAEVTDYPADLASLTRLTADLLVRCARRVDLKVAAPLAEAAAEIYRRDLGDSEAAERASTLATVLGLDPLVLAVLHDTHEANLSEDLRIRVLQVATTLGDSSLDAQRQKLDALVEARDRRLRDEARLKGRFEQARAAIATGAPDAEVLDLLTGHLSDNPADRAALDLAAGILVRLERMKDVVGLYAAGVAAASGPRDQASLLCDLGTLRMGPLADVPGALASFEEALAVDRRLPGVVEGYVRASAAMGRLEDAVAPLEKIRLEPMNRAEEARILPILAGVYTSLGRVDDAEKAWRRLRAIDPRSIAALRFYEDYHEARQDFQKLFTTLQFALSVVEANDEKVRINRKMAAIAEGVLANPDRAIEAYKRVLGVLPRDAETETALVALYEKTGKWHALVEFYNERLRHLPIEDVAHRVETLYHIIDIYRDPAKLPGDDNVLATFARVVEVAPTNLEALETLERGYRARARWPDLLKILQKKAQITSESGPLLELLRRIADIAITRMSNEALALPYLERILELDAHDLDVLQKLKGVWQKKNNPEKLYALHERELQLLTGADRIPVVSAAAALARDKLQRYEEALRLYEELYLLDTNSREARENLHQLYARLERWSDYARFLSEEVRRPMPARRRIDISHKLGEVLQDRLGDVPAARKVFEAVLSDDPNDDISVRRLEQIYLDLDELPSLHALFARRNDVRSYVAILAQREAREDVTSRKVALLQAMATACEDELNESSRALRYLERAWALDHSLVDVGRKLLDAWEAVGDMERVISILPELAPLVPSLAERLDLHARLHRALAALGRWQDAFVAGAEAVRLSLGLGNSPSALEAVRDTASTGSLWTEFAALLDEVSAATMDAEWRLALLLELGEVYKNRLLFFDEARQVLDRVLDLDPANVAAMDMLEDIALQREDYTGLEGVLRRRIDVATDPAEIRDIRMRLGRLYEDLLGDDVAAGECYMAVVHSVAGDREALAGLHRTYERAEQHTELADVIRMEIAAAIADRERARLCCDLAQLLWEHLEDPQEALSLLASALDVPGVAEEARRQLVELFDRRVDRDGAANVLAPYYRVTGRTDDLLELLYARFDDMVRSEARAAILMEIADIHALEKENPDGAFDMVLQAIGLHPAEGYVDRLLALADRVDRLADAAVAIGRWVGIVPDEADADLLTHPDPVREAALALRLGRLYADRLDRPDLAIRAFEKALPFQEGDEELLTELLGLYRRLGEIDAVLLTYDRLSDTLKDESARHDVLMARALFARESGRPDEAIETLRRVLDLFEGDPAASSELEDLLTVEGRWIEVIEVLDRREKLATSAAERAELLYQTAILLRDPLQDPAGAADRLRRAMTDAPDRVEYRAAAEGLVLDRSLPGHAEFAPALLPVLEEVLRAAGADDALIAVLRVKSDMSGSPWERVVALTDIATIEMTRGRPEAAFDALCPAISATPDDAALLDLVVAAGTASNQIPRLIEVLELAAIEACMDGRMRILLRVADIARTSMNDPARALDIYRQLLDERPRTLSVLRELDGLLASLGRDAERIPVLAEIVASSSASDDKRSTQLLMGDLSRAAGNDADAVAAFRFVLDHRPTEDRLDALALQAADRLIALFCADGEARQCVDLRLLVGRACEDPVRARDERMTAARTIYGTFGEPLQALALFEEVLASDPSDGEARDQAKACARDLQDDERLRGLLLAEIDQAADDAARIGPRMELADLYLSGEATRSDALEVLGRVLSTDPENAEARALVSGFLEDGDRAGVSAGLLEAAATKTGDLALLATALAVQVEHADDVAVRTALRLRLGACLRQQARPDEAISVVGLAFAEQPDARSVASTLVELLTAADRLPELAQRTLDAVPILPEAAGRLATRLSGAVTLLQAGHSQAAASLLEANVAEDPAHGESLELLVTAFSNVSRWEDVLRVIDLVADAATDDETRAAQYLRMADVAIIEMEDPRKAIAAFRRVLELFPLHATALAELANLYRDTRDSAGLAWLRAHELSHLEARWNDSDGPRIAELRRLLTTASLETGDPRVAIEGALKMLDAPKPGEDDLSIARRVYAEAGSPAPLFAALVSAYGRADDREGLLELYRFAAQLDLADPTRADALRGAIELGESLGHDGVLFEDLKSLAAIEPGDGALRARMESTGRRLGRLEEVLDALVDGFSRCQDQPVAFDVASSIARILSRDLGRDEDAADYLRVAFLRKPDDAPTVEALASLYNRLSRFGDLALMFETLGDVSTDRETRIQRYFESFDVVRIQVGDPVGAAEVLRKVLDEDASNRRALDELEEIARETDDAETLVTALRSKAESTTLPVERRSLVLEMARVQNEKLGDSAAAIGTLKELIVTEPSVLEAYQQIEPLLVAAEAWEDLAGVYESLADHSPSDDERIEALKKASSVREGRLAERAVAVQHLRRILEIEPGNRFAFVRLGELLEAGGEWIAYAELLKGRLAQEQGPSDRVELNARIGNVLFRETGDSPGAVEYFKAALLLDPYCEEARTGLEEMLDQSEVAMDAALALEALYDSTGRYQPLCDVLRRELTLVETPEERESILVRIAEVHRDRLADPAGALSYFGEALAANPANPETLARMDEVADQSRLWERLYSLLQDTLRGLKELSVRRRLNERAAVLAETRLGSPSGAALHYAALLRDAPDDEAVLGKLDRLYTELHRAEDLAQVLRMRISLARDASATELRLRLAAVLTTELNDPDGAVEQLRVVLTVDPRQADAIRQLSSLSNHPVAGRHALEVLAVAFRESGDQEGLVWALERQIESASEVVDTVALHDEAASAAAALKRWAVQIRHLGQALELVPSDEVLLSRLASAARDHALEDEAVHHLRQAAALASWPDLQRVLLLHAARLAISAGAWNANVEADLGRVLQLDPHCREAIDLLERQYAEQGDSSRLQAILSSKLRLDLPPAERIATLGRLADIAVQRQEPGVAIQALEECWGLEPGTPGTLDRLRTLYQEAGDATGEVSTVERMASLATDSAGKVRCLLDIAHLQERGLGDPAAARATLEGVLSQDPANEAAKKGLESLYEELGDWEPLVNQLNAVVFGTGPVADRVAAALKAAVIHEAHMDNVTTAVSLLRRAADIDPKSGAVLDELVRLSYRIEDWGGMVNVLRRKAALVSNLGEKVALLAQACEAALTQLGDLSLAGAVAQEIIALDALNPKALLVMAHLMESRSQTEDALGLFRRLVDAAGERDERVEALLGVARILLSRGEKGDEVRTCLQDAVREKPDHPEVNRHLKRLYLEGGEHQAVIEVVTRELKQASSDADKATLCMDIAEIYQRHLNDGASFLRWAEEAHGHKRDDPRVVAGIVNHHLNSGEPRRAVPYLEWLVNYLEGKRRLKELPPYAHELGRILEGMGDTDKAIQYYRMCHEHDAGNLPNALALGRLYMVRNEQEKALRVLQPLILRIDSLAGPARIEVLLALANINLAKGDKRKARQYVLRVLSEDPDNAAAQALLAQGL